MTYTSPPSRMRSRSASPAPTGTANLSTPAVPGWVLLPLRAFLGITFVYAGLQKLADPNFFRSSTSSSIQAQLRAAGRSSPIGGLLGPVQHVAVLVGVVIALVELAVGIATLLGLWGRLVAAAGLLLSFGFLLAVSWHTRPYYLGPDIVFCFAWTPLLLGPPGPWTLDRWLGARARSEEQRFDTNLVGVAFGTVQQFCGHYNCGRCEARAGAVCEPARCPVLAPHATASRAADVDFQRREFLARARLAGLVGIPLLITGGLAAAVGRALNHSKAGAPTPSLAAPGTVSQPSVPGPANTTGTGAASSTAPPPPTAGAGVAIGAVSAVPVGGAASFTDPATSQPAYVVQHRAGQFAAFSAVCTHQGCTVNFSGPGNQFSCPCHGALFDATTGAVLQGPAQDPLPAINVTVRSGQLYVNG